MKPVAARKCRGRRVLSWLWALKAYMTQAHPSGDPMCLCNEQCAAIDVRILAYRESPERFRGFETHPVRSDFRLRPSDTANFYIYS